MLVFSGKKDFQCYVCKKEFARNSDLKRHFGSYTKEKTFKCQLFDKNFTMKSNV